MSFSCPMFVLFVFYPNKPHSFERVMCLDLPNSGINYTIIKVRMYGLLHSPRSPEAAIECLTERDEETSKTVQHNRNTPTPTEAR